MTPASRKAERMDFQAGDKVIRHNDPLVGTVERVYPANLMSAYRIERQDRARIQWSPKRPWVPSSSTTSIVRCSALRHATPENIAAAKAKVATRLENFDKKVAELRRQREERQATG